MNRENQFYFRNTDFEMPIHIKVNVLGLRNREGRMDLCIWELSYKDNM